MNDKPMSKKSKQSYAGYYGLGMVIGFAAGIAIGIAMDSLPIGIAIGAGMGVSLGVGFQESKRQGTDENLRPTSMAVIALLVGVLLALILGGVLLAAILL